MIICGGLNGHECLLRFDLPEIGHVDDQLWRMPHLATYGVSKVVFYESYSERSALRELANYNTRQADQILENIVI